MTTKTMRAKTLAMLLASLLALPGSPADAHEARVGALKIEHPYALATPPGATTGGAYLKDLFNEGKVADALVGATSPAAEQVQLHAMTMDGDVMRMRAVATIAVAPGRHVAMAPGGGYHLMFIGLKKPWAVGDEVPVTLQFEHAGRVDVMLHVEERGAMSMAHQKGMTMQ